MKFVLSCDPSLVFLFVDILCLETKKITIYIYIFKKIIYKYRPILEMIQKVFKIKRKAVRFMFVCAAEHSDVSVSLDMWPKHSEM